MTKGVVVRPILPNEFSSRAKIDLIDMQSMVQNSFKWTLVHQDHLTKFVILRALTSKRAAEVAHHLLDIFLFIGAPAILQSDNGSEFTAHVIQELKIIWPTLIMVHGKPRHRQSQGSVERANGDIKYILIAWMGDNSTAGWSTGIKFVQFHKNSSLHSGIKRAPYAAMFGCDAKVGLTSSPLPTEVIERMQSEDYLLSALTAPHTRIQQQGSSATLVKSNLPNTTQGNLHVNTNPNSSMSADDLPIATVNENNSSNDTTMPVLTSAPTFAANNLYQSDGPPPMSSAPMDIITSRIDSIVMERQAARTAQFAQAERIE